MRKLIVLSAIASILLLGGSERAWATGGGHQDNDDYRVFKKIVRVLDTVVNDDHRRGGTRVIVQTQYYPKRVCRIGRYRKVCYNTRYGHGGSCQIDRNGYGHFDGRHNGRH